MKASRIQTKKEGLFYGFLLGIILAAVFLILSFFLPHVISSNYYQRSLNQLRSQANTIKKEFAALMTEMNQKKELFQASPFPENKDEIFRLLKEQNLNLDIEGIGYYNKEGDLILWLGNAVDLKPLLSEDERESLFKYQKSSFLIRHKASVFLASHKNIKENESIIFFRLLVFIPQFKAPYLKEYQFLKDKLMKNTDIDYWSFQEDVSGFEKIFSKHEDEYIGQPRLQDEFQTILFPLRNENERIVATVTLSSPSLISKQSEQKENFLLIFYLLMGVSLVSLLIYLVKSPSFLKKKKFSTGVLIILVLTGLRLIFFPLSNLEKIQSLTPFSPSLASFFSVWNLTKSPADIFLTSFFLFLIVGCLVIYSRNMISLTKKKPSFFLSLVLNSVFIFSSLFFLYIFQEFLFRLIFNSNINLLRFSFHSSFFLLHLSILLLFFVLLFILFTGLRISSLYSPNIFLPLCIFLLEFGVYFLLFKKRNLPQLFFLQAVVILIVLLISYSPSGLKRKEVLFSSFLCFTLFVYASLHHSSLNRNKSLIQNSLQNIIKSQEHWGRFVLNESLLEIDKRKETIHSLLLSSEYLDLARSLWERTLLAKLNWYSSLEILGPEGDVLSHFSLNVPMIYKLEPNLPLSPEWSTSRMSIPLIGEEKNFLIGYKDLFEEENYLGRIALYLSIDYDMLPFLYSANPYFELIRVTSIPSLNQMDLGFVIYDLGGKLIFNPDKISSGIPPPLLDRIVSSEDSLWTFFTDKKRKFHAFYLKKDSRIYSLFLPKKNFYVYAVEYMRLFFFYLVFSLLSVFFIFLAFGKRFKSPFWSFSNRVYISFVAIALIPLFLFTFFTRGFFSQIFTQQFTEKAEEHANFAQRVMDDLIFIQQEDVSSSAIPLEDAVLWISSTLSTDVNLYRQGRIVSSSRREYFDSGLLPDLIDGEIYYKIQYENNPFYTQTQRIGEYSFHTLTIPYFLGDLLLLISLPFPLEQQEISKATEELIEFLFFISVFFIAVVLIFAKGIENMIVNPIKKLLIGTEEVSLGNLEISIKHKSQDEMKTLIDGFNTMVKNLKQQQQDLADMSKKVAWAEMARKVAHEIKNPLTPIQLSAEHLLRVYEDKKEDFDKALKESASYIIKEVENLRKIAQEFLETSKTIPLQKEFFDLNKLVQETIAPYKKSLSERIQFKETYQGQDFRMKGDENKIKIALRNIFVNAIEAIRDRGQIEIISSKTEKELRLEIKDTGLGMKKETLEKVFEPYFSTKDVGTGLGLPIAKKVIEDHGGTIQISSIFKKGTGILIMFPLDN